jgi:hypothetical protein
MTGDITSALTDSNFPHVPPKKTVVFNYYTVLYPMTSSPVVPIQDEIGY